MSGNRWERRNLECVSAEKERVGEDVGVHERINLETGEEEAK